MFSGGMEWIIIGLVVLLLFGGKKIPELAKGLGQGIKNFKSAVKDDKEGEKIEEAKKEPTPTPSATETKKA